MSKLTAKDRKILARRLVADDQRKPAPQQMSKILPRPCEACPYRRDVPSGVWSAEEYNKLIEYDAPTAAQPIGVFKCHAAPKCTCHGWAVVHSGRGRENELLALRFWPSGPIPKAGVPLFGSGAEAAAHGKREIEHPSVAARLMMTKLLRRHKRLRTK